MRPEGLSHKNFTDSIGNRTRDLVACSAMPQPTTTPRMVQDPTAGAPLLRAMFAQRVAVALQACFVDFRTYRLSSRDALMTNRPDNVEKRSQHCLDIGFHLPRFLRSRR